MEFLNSILSRGFYYILGINSSLLRLEFLSGVLPSFFSFYKKLLINGLSFVLIFKTRVEYGFM
jgi:hypothetical protein